VRKLSQPRSAEWHHVRGAQGNFPVERAYAEQLRRAHLQKVPNRLAVGLLLSPEEIDRWTEGLNRRTNEEIITTFDSMVPGVAMRPGFSYLDPPKMGAYSRPAQAPEVFEVESRNNIAKVYTTEEKTGLVGGGAEIEIAKHVLGFDARPEHGHAKQRDPKGAMETGGL
jgi:hypothetical protein